MNETDYKKKVVKDKIIYTIDWSNYLECEKFNILKKLNEMTGIYAVFALNVRKRLTPLFMGGAWYTGLRSTALKLFNPTSIDPIPRFLREAFNKEKMYLKYLEIYVLEDYQNIFSKLLDIYPGIYHDTNGIEIPGNLENVKVIDNNTKIRRRKGDS